MRSSRAHNPFKLPTLIVLTLVWIGAAVYGAVSGNWVWIPVGIILAAWWVPGIWVILTGRGNPRWRRSPLEPMDP
ncbi:MAG TPA: hypothetical protein VFH80_13565 [Solirubrobacteraceae bacterium]|nr:hypothetical protein [Solirubrobacteraceae bacterium]